MIGNKIYEFRKSKNLSQEEFANSIGVTRQIVSKWESNQVVPGVDKLKKISDIYNGPYGELLKDTEYGSKKNIKKYILWFGLMIIVQVIFILLVSMISSKKMDWSYNCLGIQTYQVLEIYDSEDINYAYMTLQNNEEIRTVKVAKVISSLVLEGRMYEFVFRSNSDNEEIDYIFSNNEIINVIESYEMINKINCN